MKPLVWLASYPKSGNTWLRAFFAAYQAAPDDVLDINQLNGSMHAADRSLFDRVIGFAASDLTPDEIDRLRPEVYRSLAGEVPGPLFMKVHDCWRRNGLGLSIFPADISHVALCIVRNPLAIVPSLASHSSISIDQAIEQLANEQYSTARSGHKLKSQLHQPMGSWSQHVASWLTQSEMAVHTVRYEDLCADPVQQFRSLLEVTGLAVDEGRLTRAIAQTSFDRLQATEDAQGFKERLAPAARFFRQGKADGWRAELSAPQISRVVASHAEWMQRLGYDLES